MILLLLFSIEVDSSLRELEGKRKCEVIFHCKIGKKAACESACYAHFAALFHCWTESGNKKEELDGKRK